MPPLPCATPPGSSAPAPAGGGRKKGLGAAGCAGEGAGDLSSAAHAGKDSWKAKGSRPWLGFSPMAKVCGGFFCREIVVIAARLQDLGTGGLS